MPPDSRIHGKRRRPLAVICSAVGAAALLLPGSALARGVFITGHDSDYHSAQGPSATGAQHIMQAAIQFTSDNIAAPRILDVQDVTNPGGGPFDESDPRLGLVASGYSSFDVADYGSGAAGILDLHTVNFKNYDVVFVSSDEGGWLRQRELDVLNSRRSDITSYVNGGGGLVVMPESGLRPPGPGVDTGTSTNRLGFLPVLIGSTVLDQLETGFTLTPFGASIGLSLSDINGQNVSHTVLDSAGPYTVVDNDGAGNIVSVAGKGPFYCPGGALTLTPGSQNVQIPGTGTVNGKLTDGCGNVVPGATVSYKVISGPNTGATGSGTSDGGGNTSFGDTCTTAGTDTIQATTTSQGGVSSNTVTVTCTVPITMTGRAYGLSARVISLLHILTLGISPTPDTGPVSTPAASSTTTPCVAKISGLITADVICANVTTALGPPSSTAKSTVADVSLLGLPLVSSILATTVEADSTTTCAGSSGQSTFAKLTLGGTTYVNYKPAKNTTINLGVAKVVLNEQVAVPGGLTVNAIHVTVPLLGTDVVVASATSDIHNCP